MTPYFICCPTSKKEHNVSETGLILFLSITNKMQRYTVFSITVNALHVSGGFSAHHQELKNCTHIIWYVSSLLAATASLGISSSKQG
jgi:3,4-dihydroxy-2-butanone 4-phosphate synthase